MIHVTVGTDKPLARLIVVRRLSVDKDQVLRSGILDASYLHSLLFFYHIASMLFAVAKWRNFSIIGLYSRSNGGKVFNYMIK